MLAAQQKPPGALAECGHPGCVPSTPMFPWGPFENCPGACCAAACAAAPWQLGGSCCLQLFPARTGCYCCARGLGTVLGAMAAGSPVDKGADRASRSHCAAIPTFCCLHLPSLLATAAGQARPSKEPDTTCPPLWQCRCSKQPGTLNPQIAVDPDTDLLRLLQPSDMGFTQALRTSWGVCITSCDCGVAGASAGREDALLPWQCNARYYAAEMMVSYCYHELQVMHWP
jgi:hypothetical protein